MNEEQRIELETRLAHQEHLLNILNDEVTRQSLQIQQLENTCKLLIERIRQLGDGAQRGSAVDEIPPHY